MTQHQSTRHTRCDGSEAPMHPLAHRLQRLEAIVVVFCDIRGFTAFAEPRLLPSGENWITLALGSAGRAPSCQSNVHGRRCGQLWLLHQSGSASRMPHRSWLSGMTRSCCGMTTASRSYRRRERTRRSMVDLVDPENAKIRRKPAAEELDRGTAAKSWWSSATFVASPPLPSRGCCPAEKIGLHWRWDQPGERHHANQTLMVVVVGSRGFCISRAQRRACLTAHDCRE